MADKKFSRGANYSTEEKHLIIHVVHKYINFVENKKTNGVMWKEKNYCWSQITVEYNAISGKSERLQISLRACYENLKKNAREEAGDNKVEIFKTGGGSANLYYNPLHKKVMGFMPHAGEPLPSLHDSDASYNKFIEEASNTNMTLVTELGPSSTSSEHEEYDVGSGDLSQIPLSGTAVHGLTINWVEQQDYAPLGATGGQVDWSKYTVNMLRKPIAIELDPIHRKVMAPTTQNKLQQASMKIPSRRSPNVQKPPTTQVTEKYDKLADVKLELIKLQIEFMKKDALRKLLLENAQNKIKLEILQAELDSVRNENRRKEDLHALNLEILKIKLKKAGDSNQIYILVW